MIKLNKTIQHLIIQKMASKDLNFMEHFLHNGCQHAVTGQ